MAIGQNWWLKIWRCSLLLLHGFPCFEHSCGFLNLWIPVPSPPPTTTTTSIIIITTSSIIDMCRLLQPSLYYHHHHHHDHVHVSPSNCHRGTTCFRFTCPRSGALFHHHGLCTSKPATRLAQKTISSWAVFFCQKGDRNIEDINGGRLNWGNDGGWLVTWWLFTYMYIYIYIIYIYYIYF